MSFRPFLICVFLLLTASLASGANQPAVSITAIVCATVLAIVVFLSPFFEPLPPDVQELNEQDA